jgi:predicted alpha/beta-fold hydrolase
VSYLIKVFFLDGFQLNIIARYVQAPTWGYPSEGAYHRDASSVDSLHAIRIPFFAIQAEDDPVRNWERLSPTEVS